ncbi:rRNA-processing protein EFG1-like [Phragmites australis]|uniref:rRNA-processing protein EFG1-like n=1 Tax=Phragmites australis TaxID=29695 RepID=UPI002D7721B4|nr:rRNA-processing protein EFG1-like [Phragmites australis]
MPPPRVPAMARGGYPRRGAAVRRPKSSASAAAADRKRKRTAASKTATLKNQIRSTERFLRKDLPNDIRVAQEKKLEELKRQQELQNELAVQRTVQLRDRKIKFFERRKIERMIRRLEKQQRSNVDDASNKLSKLREDLEYVRFFPKNEKYVSLFTGGNNPDIVEKRSKWRKQVKENLMAAAANGKDLEETASDDDTLDVSDDDFFMSGSSSDEEADDEWTDKSAKEPASCASGRAASGMSSDEKNQHQRDARALMPPPRSLAPNRARSADKHVISSSSNTSNSTSGDSFKNRRVPNHPGDHNSNLSSNSDAHKPRRKRRHKKKKKLA